MQIRWSRYNTFLRTLPRRLHIMSPYYVIWLQSYAMSISQLYEVAWTDSTTDKNERPFFTWIVHYSRNLIINQFGKHHCRYLKWLSNIWRPVCMDSLQLIMFYLCPNKKDNHPGSQMKDEAAIFKRRQMQATFASGQILVSSRCSWCQFPACLWFPHSQWWFVSIGTCCWQRVAITTLGLSNTAVLFTIGVNICQPFKPHH